eukprot:CAMPEP_0196580730 /NCGR_PEP_ID=MMETSP1081-20130531/30288_1 /TAXON_ID=36882 /ORGANISM="Pyramimonas amylifera, Strain CCMP720" /LENGTH=318 /DNA_ID=CAMNT_0041900687 /DNA_START=123 /DNA_END=1079 /DNA_ORIENTATION=+
MAPLSRLRAPRRQKAPLRAQMNANQEHNSEALNFYELLEIETEVLDPLTLRANYRRLQKVYHPDVFGDAGVRSQELNEAYATLRDEKARLEYDRGFGKLGRPSRPLGKEGLVGPICIGNVLAEEVLECASKVSEDAMCQVSWEEDGEGPFNEAVTYVRQWASTMAFAAEVPLPSPLQCDPVEDGVRVAVISTAGGRIVSLGQLLFTVVEAESDPQGLEPAELSVQVRRQVSSSSKNGSPSAPLPGEARILKGFRTAMRRWRGQDQPRAWGLTGLLATVASGAVGMLPWGVDDARAYDGYYLRQKRPVNSTGFGSADGF